MKLSARELQAGAASTVAGRNCGNDDSYAPRSPLSLIRFPYISGKLL